MLWLRAAEAIMREAPAAATAAGMVVGVASGVADGVAAGGIVACVFVGLRLLFTQSGRWRDDLDSCRDEVRRLLRERRLADDELGRYRREYGPLSEAGDDDDG